MQCPTCNQPLETKHHHELDLHRCSQCGGLWFSHNELSEAIAKEDPVLQWLATDIFSDPKRFQGTISTRRCPVDKLPLRTLTYDGTGVKVDVCALCKGMWLDKGEFESILATLKKRIAAENLPSFIRYFGKEAVEMVTGEKGIGEELAELGAVGKLLEYRILAEWPMLEDILFVVEENIG